MTPEHTDDLLGELDLKGLLTRLRDAVIVSDGSGLILFGNVAAEELLGYSAGALTGVPLTELVPDPLRALHSTSFDRYFRTGSGRLVDGARVQVDALRRDRRTIPIELTLTGHQRADGRPLVVGVLRDQSDRVALEEERTLRRHLEANRDIATQLALLKEGASPEGAGTMAMSVMGPALGRELAAVWVREGDVLRPVALWCAEGREASMAEMYPGDLAFPIGAGLPGTSFASHRTVWMDDLQERDEYLRSERARRVGLRSGFAFPVIVAGAAVAVLEFYGADVTLEQSDTLGAVQTASSLLGQYLEREKRSREARSAEAHLVEMAQAFQRSLLPPRPPTIPGVEIDCRYHAAGPAVIGGDFYDVFPGPEGTWAISIGDVRGRGAEAAAVAALGRYTLRASGADGGAPSHALKVLNGILAADQADRYEPRFLTGQLLQLSRHEGTVEVVIASAGHPAPLLQTAERGVESVAVSGHLLGVLEEVDIIDVRIRLEPGDSLVLYTDGLLEATSAGGTQFGREGVLAVLGQSEGRTARELGAALEMAVLEHAGNTITDDLAIVVLRNPG